VWSPFPSEAVSNTPAIIGQSFSVLLVFTLLARLLDADRWPRQRRAPGQRPDSCWVAQLRRPAVRHVILHPYDDIRQKYPRFRHSAMTYDIPLLWLKRLQFCQSHWLYPLIFAEVEPHWERAQLTDTQLGEPPQHLHLFHCLADSRDGLNCQPPLLRAWRYSRDGIRTLLEALPDFQQRGAQQGRFYEIAQCSFFLLPGHRRVLLNLTFGPRYGQGWIGHIKRSGKTRTLERDMRILWAS
jgi:hypothetical protein